MIVIAICTAILLPWSVVAFLVFQITCGKKVYFKKGYHMKKNLITKIVAGLALLYSVQSALYAAEPKISGTMILKNNSSFNIKYKLDNPERPVRPEEELLLSAGDSIMIDTMKVMAISIRRSGLGSGYVSSWVQVPDISDLTRKLSKKDANEFDIAIGFRKCTPIINIQSGYTGGWSFNLAVTCY